jgi:hypothetical protein
MVLLGRPTLCRAEAMSSGTEIVLLILGVYILAAFGFGLSFYRSIKNRRKG